VNWISGILGIVNTISGIIFITQGRDIGLVILTCGLIGLVGVAILIWIENEEVKK
jgi:hypothetical protein